MKIVARKGSEERRVRLVHWWPGRWWWTEDAHEVTPLPYSLIKQANEGKNRYMTYASVNFGTVEISAWARCCPKDQPTRAEGRAIVLERLGCALEQMGWELEVR